MIEAGPRRVGADEDDRGYVREVIERIVRECPRRTAGSESERRAQEILLERYRELGVEATLEPFETHDHVYADLALHYGLGVLGSLLFGVAPAASFALHSLVGTSHLLESTRQVQLLRSLLPKARSQNLVATLPARGEPALRVVLVAHADAAYTGYMFDPDVLRRSTRGPRLLSRPLRLAAASQLALAAVDLVGMAAGPAGRRLLWPVVGALSIPGLVTFALNLEVVLRNEPVPGANDNLSGSAALGVLAGRLAARARDDVELVFVVTGAEEAGVLGARALARARRERWDRRRTVILAVDGLSNGEMCWFQEGEIVEVPECAWLADVGRRVAATDPRFAAVGPYRIPAGGTDVLPFRAAGYDGIGLGCVDREIGAPRHYHRPSDTPDNLDLDQLMTSIDFVERFTSEVIRTRLG